MNLTFIESASINKSKRAVMMVSNGDMSESACNDWQYIFNLFILFHRFLTNFLSSRIRLDWAKLQHFSAGLKRLILFFTKVGQLVLNNF